MISAGEGEAIKPRTARRPVLDPVSRATEVLFGLIMVLTFTASFNAAGADHADVRLMLIAALGCNLAWGLIDAAMYLISVQSERALGRETIHSIRTAASPEIGRAAVAEALPPVVAAALSDAEIERIRLHVGNSSGTGIPTGLGKADLASAVAVFTAVFLATLPVVLPFMLIDDPRLALRVSHAIAITLLFLAGATLGRNWGRAWQVGLAMVVLGVLLVAVAMALGG